MIIYVIPAFAGAHISLLTTVTVIIFPLGKADPEKVSSVMSVTSTVRVFFWAA